MTVSARLADRCAIVTGTCGGIGAAVAARFAEEGARVACLDLDGVCAVPGGIGVAVDVSDEASVEAAVAEVLEAFGRMDVVCNAASTAGPELPAVDTPVDEWDRTVAVSLRGTFLVAKHTLRALAESGGNIVNVASALAFTGWRRGASSGPGNAGIVQLTQSLALDHARSVRVNCVCPGVGNAPLGDRPVAPEEIADGVLFLASGDASFMTGATLPIDGGLLAS